jgi:phosphatidylserine/phosphatidylglycerophosphate/cardiolipin synthase-like enzyme
MSPFARLSRSALFAMAQGLESGRLTLPTYEFVVAAYVGNEHCRVVMVELNQLVQQGMHPQHLAYMLKLLAHDRQLSEQFVDLVWSGPEVAGAESRDTGVVFRELFAHAKRTVHLASYVLDTGKKGRDLFEGLALKMDSEPNLRVRFFVNVQRKFNDDRTKEIILANFAQDFRRMWPGKRVPDMFFDPRALEPRGIVNACLHAKCLIIDERWVLVTSANFTEAAQERNIEAGVVLDNQGLAKRMVSQFERLVGQKYGVEPIEI